MNGRVEYRSININTTRQCFSYNSGEHYYGIVDELVEEGVIHVVHEHTREHNIICDLNEPR